MTLEKNGKVAPPSAVVPREWHALKADEVLHHLEVQGNGLTSEEAKRRLEYYGPNQLKEAPRPTFLQMLWEQLNNFVVILLIIASVISALLGDYVEAAAIMAIVVLNAVLGIVQERRAEEALAALKKLAAPDAQVMRDRRRVSIPSTRAGVPWVLVHTESFTTRSEAVLRERKIKARGIRRYLADINHDSIG